jgi:hypothetical protein
MENQNQQKPPKSRLSFILRDKNEFSHSKGTLKLCLILFLGINSVALGKYYRKDSGKL